MASVLLVFPGHQQSSTAIIDQQIPINPSLQPWLVFLKGEPGKTHSTPVVHIPPMGDRTTPNNTQAYREIRLIKMFLRWFLHVRILKICSKAQMQNSNFL